MSAFGPPSPQYDQHELPFKYFQNFTRWQKNPTPILHDSRVDAEDVLLGLDWGRCLGGGRGDGADDAGLALLAGDGRGRLLRRRVETCV